MSSKIPSNPAKVDFLSEYNLRGIIGKGTFSVVKLGEHKKTKEKVAIKILQKNKILNKEDLVRIEREIEILKRLKHPNVIKIHRIEEDDKKFYIIMEFCENGELFNRIVERRYLTEDEAALFYYQLINGLEYIHKNNIVHRDLKPENLLLSKNDLLKIIDFGLSNYTGYNILLGTPCGSPCYASPEMVSGQRYNGYMIDVWSTGIILFAMVNGYLPFEDNNNEILFGKILKCKIHYPKTMGELTLDLMKKIITPDPKKRITLEQIKHHPFYLKGKELFKNKFPELVDEINGINNDNISINANNNINNGTNTKIKEIVIKNVSPIVNNNILKNIKDNKQKNNININTNSNNNKYYSINIKDINNIYYHYPTTEISSTIPNNIDDLNKPKLNQIKPQITSNKKEIMLPRDYKLDSPSSLQSDEIPKDSDPIRITEEKNKNSNIKEKKIEIKRNMKEELKMITLAGQSNSRKYKIYRVNPISQNKKITANEKIKIINEQIKTVAKSLGENIDMNKSQTKEKDRKKNNEINYIPTTTNKINEPMIDNLYQKEKMSSTLDNTTTIATKMEFYNTNDDQKNKFSSITHKIDKNSYLINKANQTYDVRNKNEINNNPKFVKITKTLSKRIQKKPIYVNINKENENINNLENNINLTNVTNPNFVKINSRINSYSFDEGKNNVKQNNNNNIKGIFNEFQLIQGNKNQTLNNDNIKINTNNIITSYNNTINVNDRNIRIPLMIGKTSTATQQIPRKDLNNNNNNNKENYKYNNYINTRNNINTNTEKKSFIINKVKNLSMSHHPKYRKIINPTNNNNKIYISNNTTNFQGVNPMNDKYFDTITINNNNNINFHEPKLYIYVQNNNNTNDYQRLKTESNPKKTKMIFKFENKNNNTINTTNKINSVDYNNTPGKRMNSNIIQNKTIDNDFDKRMIHKITPIKNNQTIYNKEIKSTEKFMITKKIYNSIDPNKRIYTYRTNDMAFDNSKKNKDNNMKYITSKINNNNIYFERNYNTIDSKNEYINNNNNTTSRVQNNYNRLAKPDYIYQNMHSVVKTDGNMDLWSYDNERIVNDNKVIKNNYVNNSQRAKKAENINNLNTFENLNYRERIQKLQMKSYISNNKENDNKNMRYIIQNHTNTVNSINYGKIHPVISTPETKQNTNNKNIINYKHYIKQY